MRNRDLDKNMGGRMNRSDIDSSRKHRSTGGSEPMRNRADDVHESAEDLQRRQSEGNLGNERVRESSLRRARMRGAGE